MTSEKRLRQLEAQSIFILREAYAHYKKLGFLWSIGKDSTVVLWLIRKAFLGHIPMPVLHVDTKFKIPEMIQWRDRLSRDWGFELLISTNQKALDEKQTFPDGNTNRLQCCKNLKSEALKAFTEGSGPHQFEALILGIRADEEGSRSKERYFSPRSNLSQWDVGYQPPEFWNQFQVEYAPGTHVRIHPLLDWTELQVWEYLRMENVPLIPLYFDQGQGERYRSIGCAPCTQKIKSTSKNWDEVIQELDSGQLSKIAERSGRSQDDEDGGTLEKLRRDGYM